MAVKASGTVRVLDVNLRPPFFDARLTPQSVECASVLKLSDHELEEVAAARAIRSVRRSKEMLRALLQRFSLDLVVMTRGAEGASLVSPVETIL
jgi:fructokinase